MQDYRFKNRPYAHQAAYLVRFWDKPESALFADMGTGKSFMLINNTSMLYDNGLINGALIVAPKGVYRNWAELEIPKHLPDHVMHTIALWTPAPNKKQEQALSSVFEPDETLHILVMNVEAFSTPKGAKFAEKFLLAHNAIMAVDESTTIKSKTAQRTKTIYKLGRFAKYRRILTGSPVTKSPLDLYTQCAFLSPDLLGFSSFYAFQSRYAVLARRSMGPRTFNQVVGYRRLDELSEKLQEFAFRVTKEECIDLPPKVYMKREVLLTDQQAVLYNQMKGMALAMLENGQMTTTATALTQLLRLHQICCGHLRTDDGELHEIPNNRLDALLECVEETAGKAIIWANYTHDILAIEKALSKAYGGGCAATYYGDTDGEERQKIVTRFQDPDSELRFFIGQPKTGGYGLTLTEASTVIYYSNSYDLEVRLQSEDRCVLHGTPVLTDQGWKPIQDVALGEHVLNAQGNWTKVIDAWNKECLKTLVEVSVRGWSQPLTTTHDHLWRLSDGSWKKAEELRPGDVIAQPESSLGETDLDSISFPENCRKADVKNGRYCPAPKLIMLDEETLFVLGYFVGDGFASAGAGKGRFVSFSGNTSTKLRSLKRVKAWISNHGMNYHESIRGNTVEVRAFSVDWAHWFLENFGHLARNKTFPEWRLSKKQWKWFLDGLIASDGYKRKGRIEYVTASSKLAARVFRLVQQLGFKPCLSKLFSGHHCVAFSETAETGYKVSTVTFRNTKKTGGKRERVYDLTVEEGASFTIGGCVVHNCHRIGQTKSVTYIDLITPKSVDEKIVTALRNKIDIATQVLGEELKEWLI